MSSHAIACFARVLRRTSLPRRIRSFLTEMKSKNAGGGPVNGTKVGQSSGRVRGEDRRGEEEEEEVEEGRDRHGDVNRNDNDYGRSYRGASFLNDYVLENYYA